jgi:hypothetical protein
MWCKLINMEGASPQVLNILIFSLVLFVILRKSLMQEANNVFGSV